MTETTEAAPSMTLKPSARLQRFLGSELIADPNLAVLEFVKNAYDAGAKNVIVQFFLSGEPTSVSIADDGIGMDEDSFRFNWLRPGFSQKSITYRGDGPSLPQSGAAAKLATSRKPAGEKGLGRLSAGRLGKVLTVWTRPSKTSQWLRVEFDWSRFDDMYRAMDEISIPFEYRDSAPPEAFELGTLIQISDLSQSWVGKIPGRPAPGRPRTRLGRLKQDLSFLIRAQAGKDKKFHLELDADVVTETSDVGIISPESSRLDTAQYVYRFEISAQPIPNDDLYNVNVERSIQRSAEAVRATGRPSAEKLESTTDKALSATKWPGPVTGFFLYTPPPAGRRAQDIDLASTGVLLYRDDVLVEPYGLPGNDWLGVEARKASRQGHAAIQPSTFSGEVQVSRTTNPELVDMSNRLGLLDNDASAEFIRLLRREFDVFEEIIYTEVLIEGNWQGSREKKAAQQAELGERFAQLRLKALAHRAGQPLQAMGFDVVGLQVLADDESIPAGIRAKLKSHADKIETNVERLARVVRELSTSPSLDSSEFDIALLIEQIVSDSSSLADQHEVQLVTEDALETFVFAARALVQEVLLELVTNAIEAARNTNRVGTVTVQLSRPTSTYVEVRVRDDGSGFGEQSSSVHDLGLIQSTKGRPAEGLVTAENSIVATRGALWVESTNDSGTCFVVQIPTGASPAPGKK